MVSMLLRALRVVSFAVILWFIHGCGTASAQSAMLSGRVVDAETAQPLPGVNVFLNQTMIGAVTDEHGRFKIEPVAPGSYEVVASMVGYGLETEYVEVIPEQRVYDFSFRLAPVVVPMNEIEVTAQRPRGWRRDLRRFERLFLGTGPNARQTHIRNPYVLDFETQDRVFSAQASAPLEIDNLALGYKITFVLTEFRMDGNTNLLYMQGPFHFQELKPEDADEAAAWERNRRETFKGSLQHVLSSMIQGTTSMQDISVQLDDREDAPYSEKDAFLTPIEGLGFIEGTERPYLYRLRFPHYLYIEYYRTEYQREESWIKLNFLQAKVHESGYVYAPAGAPGLLTVYGALSRRRIADLLPREYNWEQQP